jgi:DNA helicase TIP49 (TBP-interacting protein)
MYRKRKWAENDSLSGPECSYINLIDKVMNIETDCKGILIDIISEAERMSLINTISKALKYPCTIIQSSNDTPSQFGEKLFKAFQNSLAFQSNEKSSVLEGEVVNIEYNFTSFDKKKCSSGKVTLASSEMESTYQFGPFLGSTLFKSKIKTGDLIKIDGVSCSVIKTDLASKVPAPRLPNSFNLSDIGDSSYNSDCYPFPMNEHLWENLSANLNTIISDNRISLSRGIIVCEVLELNEDIFSYLEKLLEDFYFPFLIIISSIQSSNYNSCFLRGFLHISP